MVAAVRRGESARAVARRFGVSTSTVVYWVERARGHRLDRVDWADRSRAPRHTRRTNAAVEDLILRVRRQLRQRSEEHTSELQSHHDLVCRLLLEKKNNAGPRQTPPNDK